MALTGSRIVGPYFYSFIVAASDDFVVVKKLEAQDLFVFVVAC